jgi:2-polyprenyl-3-methyl-5-hydroxy-6-metoxy-1,4-benzoquinol methylase
MQLIPCPLCEQDDTLLVDRRRQQGLWVATVCCRTCGLVYHNPVLEDDDRRDLELSFRQLHTDSRRNSRQQARQERRWRLQWPLLKEHFQPGGRVLEVGCGLGVIAGRLKTLGAQVWGVEPDQEQAAYARRHLGLTVFQARFEEVEFPAEPFDLILASHVIEHFPNPLSFLKKSRTLAHPGSRLFLETPNILAPKVSYRRLFSLAHNFYFCPDTLEPLLNKAGWRVERLKVWRRDSFQVLARPADPVAPRPDPATPGRVLRAISRHRYLYYLKLLFLWRKLPWWQRHWMYTPACDRHCP